MTFAAYQATEGVNWSSLREMRESALHYRHALVHPRPETAPQVLGRYTHAAILRPQDLATDFVVWTEGRRAGEFWRTFQEQAGDRTIISEDDVVRVQGMVDAVRRSPHGAELRTAGGQAEVSLTWYDPSTRLPCKGRVDWLRRAGAVVAELKTTRSTDLRLFGADLIRFGYHGQLAHYVEGIAHALGWRPERAIIVAVESAPPHDVALFELDAEVLEAGRELRDGLLEQVAACTISGIWPGRHPAPVVLDATNLPSWAFGTSTFEATEEAF